MLWRAHRDSVYVWPFAPCGAQCQLSDVLLGWPQTHAQALQGHLALRRVVELEGEACGQMALAKELLGPLEGLKERCGLLMREVQLQGRVREDAALAAWRFSGVGARW